MRLTATSATKADDGADILRGMALSAIRAAHLYLGRVERSTGHENPQQSRDRPRAGFRSAWPLRHAMA